MTFGRMTFEIKKIDECNVPYNDFLLYNDFCFNGFGWNGTGQCKQGSIKLEDGLMVIVRNKGRILLKG
jgi:hypothetical protein